MDKKLAWLENAYNTLKHSDKDSWVTLSEDIELVDLGLDSLDVVELQMMYEEDFDCQVPDPVEDLIFVKDLLNLLK